MPLTVHTLRHGQSHCNALGICQGTLDTPPTDLDSVGLAQAGMMADALVRECGRYGRIFSSPLRRAASTAKVVREKLESAGLDPGVITWVEELRERDLGAKQGRPFVETDGEEFMHGEEFRANPGESMESVSTRVGDWWQRAIAPLAGKHEGEKILIISHGYTLSALLNRALRGKGYTFTPPCNQGSDRDWIGHNCERNTVTLCLQGGKGEVGPYAERIVPASEVKSAMFAG